MDVGPDVGPDLVGRSGGGWKVGVPAAMTEAGLGSVVGGRAWSAGAQATTVVIEMKSRFTRVGAFIYQPLTRPMSHRPARFPKCGTSPEQGGSPNSKMGSD